MAVIEKAIVPPTAAPQEAPMHTEEDKEHEVCLDMIKQQLEGVMYHDSMKWWCKVLGLKGFAEIHKHQIYEELESYLKVKGKYVKATKHIPHVDTHEFAETLRSMEEKVNEKRGVYGESEISDEVKNMIEHYYRWETKALKNLIKWKPYLKDKEMINEMIGNVMCEVDNIETLMKDLECENYSYDYICKAQPYLYFLYK